MATDTMPIMSEAADPGEDRVDPHNPVSLTDQLAAILRRGIETGRLAGDLPSESELREQHGVSRVTTRRALTRLRDEGLLGSAKGRGWWVVPEAERRPRQ